MFLIFTSPARVARARVKINSDRTGSARLYDMYRLSALVLCAASALELAPRTKILHRRDALRAATALATAAVAGRAAAADSNAAIAVDRAGFTPELGTGRAGKNFARVEDSILGARGTKKVVTIEYEYPRAWTSLRNSVDLINGNTGTVATVLAAPLGDASLDSRKFYECIFSPDGKIQRAGTPIDEFKVLRVTEGPEPGYKEVALRYTAISPNQRLVDRRATAVATAVGDTAYLFLVSAAAVKWKDEEALVTTVARTFRARY